MNKNLRYFCLFIQAAIFSFAVAFMDWESIRAIPFSDTVNYADRIVNIYKYNSHYTWENTILGWFIFEILWFKILEFGAYLNVDPLTFLKYISSLTAFLTYIYIRRHFGAIISAAILLNPISIDLFSSQIRSGLAFSIFLTAISIGSGKYKSFLKIFGLLLTPFIHSAMLVVCIIYTSSQMMDSLSKIPEKYKQFLYFSVIFFASIALSIYASSVLGAIGDRRQLEGIALKSHAYMAYWYLLAIVFAIPILWTKVDWRVYFSSGALLIGIVMNTFGIAGFRFIAMSLPIIISSVNSLKKEITALIILVSIIYDVCLFYFWVRPVF